jgi:hypothetical protein
MEPKRHPDSVINRSANGKCRPASVTHQAGRRQFQHVTLSRVTHYTTTQRARRKQAHRTTNSCVPVALVAPGCYPLQFQW